MANQLNAFSDEQIVVTSLHTEVQRSYLEYAMSVIVGRALPDVRDGLKPVHRRILYAMHELGLTPERPFRKCARVVGDVLGKYHPHGDQAVYDALVRMVQDFSSRYPLLDGHGNFGSVDNDPPAAMRYTETRLAPVSHQALLGEISEATVDFSDNFDSSQQEPTVLPAQLPNLLLNGSSGIAVGMATNIPPHNLGEVIDGLVALIDRPTLSDDALFKLIPGPDFPTGGEIIDTKGVHDAYCTGRGSIPVRGIAGFEEIQPGKGRQRRNAIVVTELPYQVNKAGWIEKVASLVNQGKLEGIIDIRDESDREGMRVVIELKREFQPPSILADLYRMTPLQSNFGAIMLAIDGGQPVQMSLRQMLQSFLDFREETLVRQYSNELEKTDRRLHIVEGLLTALDSIDEVIEILRAAPDGPTAKVELCERFDLSERQADAILAMPLRRLVGLEQDNLLNEFEELSNLKESLELLLSDRKERLKCLKKDLRKLKKSFGDERRTRLRSDSEREEEETRLATLTAKALEEDTVVEVTRKGYVRRFTPRAYQRQQSKQVLPTNKFTEQDDIPVQTEFAWTTHNLLVFSQEGKAFSVMVNDIPMAQRQSKGRPLFNLLPDAIGLTPDGLLPPILLDQSVMARQVILVTAQGKIKRLPMTEFESITARGLVAIKLKPEDHLAYAVIADLDQDLVLASSGGRLLRFAIDPEQLPDTSRSAQGNQAIRVIKGEAVVGCVPIQDNSKLLLMSEKGYGKRMQVATINRSGRGGIGSQSFKFSQNGDRLATLLEVPEGTDFTVMTSQDRAARLPVNRVPVQGRSQPCDRILTPTRGETITDILVSVDRVTE
ncbi:DNA gyrase subunit A [Leptothoe sp. PORK10 BA2]|uniref:DNA gyrase subunit A n=1 Tax=Leptothoe sp. PORK10 BA2 TaxID=3110254 RepID=UPI002B1FDC61|nr:DNA gyrase subunit A [Leptothoe sp. PORK10 BA2]MEA5463431.1 DNA gyrase subunit A [Leptothoe sp. PORK10 BA2]